MLPTTRIAVSLCATSTHGSSPARGGEVGRTDHRGSLWSVVRRHICVRSAAKRSAHPGDGAIWCRRCRRRRRRRAEGAEVTGRGHWSRGDMSHASGPSPFRSPVYFAQSTLRSLDRYWSPSAKRTTARTLVSCGGAGTEPSRTAPPGSQSSMSVPDRSVLTPHLPGDEDERVLTRLLDQENVA